MISSENKKQAIAQYYVVKSQGRPQVAAALQTVEILKTSSSAGNGDLNIPGRDTNIGLFAGLNLTYPLLAPGYSEKVDLARRGLDMSKVTDIKSRGGIILSVRNAYYGYLSSIMVVRLRERIKNNYEVRLGSTKVMVRNGDRPLYDLSAAEASFSQAQLDYDQAMNNQMFMRSELFAAMGVPETEGELLVEDIRDLPELKYNLSEMYRIAEEHSPDIILASYQKDTARVGIEVAQAAHSPYMNLYVMGGMENDTLHGRQYFNQNFRSENWTPSFHGGVLSGISVYSGGGISASVDSALAEYNKAIYNERKIAIQVRKQITQSVSKINAMRKQIEISHVNVRNAQINLEVSKKMYDNGVGAIALVQNAEMAVFTAELAEIDAKFGYLNALALLANLVGLDEALLCKK